MKRILYYLFTVILVFVALLLIDLGCIFILNRPILSIKDNEDKVNDVYYGVLYDAYKCHDKNKIKIVWKNEKFNCPMLVTEKNFEVIEEEMESCDTALEEIYETDLVKYFLPCIKSDKISIKIKDKQYLLKDALNKRIVYIDDVVEKYNEIIVKPTFDFDIELKNGKNSTITYDKYNIHLENISNIYVTTYSLKIPLEKALNNKQVSIMTIQKMIDSSINYTKDSEINENVVYKNDYYKIQFCGNNVYFGDKDSQNKC